MTSYQWPFGAIPWIHSESKCSYVNPTTSFQGWGDVKVPDVLQMHLPLFPALAVSPLMLLAPVQGHTQDFSRSALVGVCHKSSMIKFNNNWL
jgi:hypothetical protein